MWKSLVLVRVKDHRDPWCKRPSVLSNDLGSGHQRERERERVYLGNVVLCRVVVMHAIVPTSSSHQPTPGD